MHGHMNVKLTKMCLHWPVFYYL